MKLKGTLIVPRDTHLLSFGYFAESVDQTLVVFVLGSPGFYVFETLGNIVSSVGFFDDEVSLLKLGSRLYFR
jgi:hypothetical protein